MRGHALSAREVDVEELESREPRISGAQLRSVGHHVKSGIELAATVAPLLHQRSIQDDVELDARERGRHFNGARPFVGRGGFSITRGGVQAREVELELDARDPFSFGKFFKGAVKGAGKVAGNFLKREDLEDGEIIAREFKDAELEEIAARDPFSFGKFLKGAAKDAGKVAGAFIKRENTEDDDMFAREFNDAELEELAAREPFSVANILKGATNRIAGFHRREDEDGVVYTREFEIDELD